MAAPMTQPTGKPIDFRAIVGAKGVRWVREDVYLAVVAERDAAEGLLAAVEQQLAGLLAEVSRLTDLAEPLPL